jgi:hypothetical protein
MKTIFFDDEKGSDLILQGQLKKNTGTFGLSWQARYAKLYPNRLELYYENKEKDPEVYTMERIETIESKEVKGQKTISIHLRNGNEPRLILSPQVWIFSCCCCCFSRILIVVAVFNFYLHAIDVECMLYICIYLLGYSRGTAFLRILILTFTIFHGIVVLDSCNKFSLNYPCSKSFMYSLISVIPIS